jgi:hypothetical protein
MKKLCSGILFILFSINIQANAEFYKWVDENGVTRFSNTGSPEKYKDKTSKAEEAKYADQPQRTYLTKENIVNNVPHPVVINNTPTISSQKNNFDEMVKLERNRLQESMKDKPAQYSGRSSGYTAKEREFHEHAEAKRKEKVKKDLDLLNKDPNQYFYNKPIEERAEVERKNKAAENAAINAQSQIHEMQNQINLMNNR